MPQHIVINATAQELRVATLENGRLLQIDVERSRERSVVGSIYTGRVTRVLPGIQAAFVDIGLARTAFLPASDFVSTTAFGGAYPLASDGNLENPSAATAAPTAPKVNLAAIEDRLRDGAEVVVQIAKEPIGSKGARVTCHISLPGRLVVYLPYGSGVAVSRRIGDEDERGRLQAVVETVLGGRGGAIVRTASAGADAGAIETDLGKLCNLWQSIEAKPSCTVPMRLHRDLDVVLRTVRDLSASDAAGIVVDSPDAHRRILGYLDQAMPGWRPRVDLYRDAQPIFERFGIEQQIKKALQRKVWLRSGGYLIFDPTEALTSIDVNSGRFVGMKNQRDTALRINLEAARAIGEQLRLRNIGGVVVVDFIDMDEAEDCEAVRRALQVGLRAQATLAEVSGFSELGLVEITRRRNRESLSQQLCEPCPTCAGTGRVPATASTAYGVLRQIRRAAATPPRAPCLTVSVHPAIAAFFSECEPTALADLELELGVELLLQPSADFPVAEYQVAPTAGGAG